MTTLSANAVRATTYVLIAMLCAALSASAQSPKTRSWAADNGNGTYSNPLFYDEFSDPDMIRVGPDYYLTGTTMHTMPGLPILHSQDLVNWRIIGYALDRLDLGPDFRLEDGKEIYGQGIWAPSFRYHNGTYYIFANVNRFGLQVFRASDPRGPWKHNRIQQGLHDLSVLFDDDGRIYAVYGASTIRIVEMNADLTALVPGTDRVLIDKSLGMGEGSHIYKIKGKYYIVSAVPGAHVPMKCARAESLAGPWEVKTISENESLGIGQGYRPKNFRRPTPPFEVTPPNPSESLSLTLHQGGIIETDTGEWWGYSMQDHNAVGRLTSLSPVTWVEGWPYFGLPGNLTRTPSLWVKPNTGRTSAVTSPYDRNDDFSGPKLQQVWQWNHLPDDSKWSLTERPGYLRLHSLPAPDFWLARNTLTQRAMGPESIATTEVDAAGLKNGDAAGLALLNLPYSWVGVSRREDQFALEFYDQRAGKPIREALAGTRVRLRVHCDFDKDTARFSYSANGKEFKDIGPELILAFQLKTFQGVRFGLFHYNASGAAGGQADFDSFTVLEPRSRGLTQPIPAGKWITFSDLSSGNRLAAVDGKLLTAAGAGKASAFQVVDRGRGRVALRTAQGQFVSVSGAGKSGEVVMKAGKPGDAETFQWVDLQRGDTLLLSLVTHRYITAPKEPGPVSADHPGPAPDRKDGSCFTWKPAQR
ncbi:family 43 glycosylhydrolase [uncultured Paludibaculum sp.]|uniref:family 43 glycosylhydrolase n=1 Tax=uncultured Paludibaculum sp. TaxID=1765020 RepID=UPI002AAB50A5|nr:family 43 glycosylhydrolase [uncultured Paludibaculum sp.]